jgi:hypothetical protein
MKLEIALFGELQRMKEKMDRIWNGLFEKSLEKKEENSRWIEKLPGVERTGRRSLGLPSNKNIRSFSQN